MTDKAGMTGLDWVLAILMTVALSAVVTMVTMVLVAPPVESPKQHYIVPITGGLGSHLALVDSLDDPRVNIRLGGRLVGIGTVAYNFTCVEMDSLGNLLHLTVLDHGAIERYYTVSAYAEANGMKTEEVYYFLNKFFEWKIVKEKG